MLPITVYNQKGGQAKSTVTRDLAAAFAELDLNVLIVDFDAQNSSVSNYLNVDDQKHNPEADNIALHLIDQGKGPFRDLIRTYNENIDVLPSHKQFNNIDDLLDEHAQYLKASKPDDWEYPRHKRFFKILQQNNIQEEYDVMLVDPNAKADEAYYLALYATWNIVIPAKPTRGGVDSIPGVEDSAENFAEEMDISITNAGVIPTKFDQRSNVHKENLEKIRNEYPAPVYFKKLTAFEKAEGNYTTVFEQLRNNRIRSSSEDIMPKYRTLASYIFERAGRELPNGGWSEDKLFLGDERWGDVDPTNLAGHKEKVGVN